MRPIGAIAAGFIGDRFNCSYVLIYLMLLGSISLLSILLLGSHNSAQLIIFVVMTIGLITYAIRGIFWSTLESCEIPIVAKGMAVGFMSLVGYSPDIYLPMISGYLLDHYPEKMAYSIYFSIIASGGFIGAFAAWRLYVSTKVK